MRSFLVATAIVTALAASPSAHASHAEEQVEQFPTHSLTTPPPHKARAEWYGWQILVTDVATVATTAVLLSVEHNESYGQYHFMGGYLSGGPIVHLTHRNYGQAVGSLAMRAALPVIGAYVGCAAYGQSGEMFGCLPGMAMGVLLGMVSATAADAAALSWADEKPRPKTFEVMPSASVTNKTATFGLQGIF